MEPILAMLPAETASGGTGGLWGLFTQSFDAFTVVLLVGSVVGLAWVVRTIVEVREAAIVPARPLCVIIDAADAGRWDELRGFVASDDSMPSLILRQALSRRSYDKSAMRELAELAASEESSRWFRKIELLNVIGNLGPLVGLAGTVWGMILAFTALGEVGGQAGPTDLSLGISKALFHTLLGLCLAIPCLFAYGIYRSVIDRHCTRAMVVAAKVIEQHPGEASGTTRELETIAAGA
ncbi:MAG: MotA/TolQ/ExbB proton channel family protein [Planctomycetota bacterium]